VDSNIIPPRVIRLKDAPKYLGMDKNRFNLVVRPEITEIPYSPQCIGFDRIELDLWLDSYKNENGKTPTPSRLQLPSEAPSKTRQALDVHSKDRFNRAIQNSQNRS